MGEKYKNMDDVQTTKSLFTYLRWRRERSSKKKDYSQTIPHCSNKKATFLQQNTQETTVTWVGHATFLIQMQGLHILTDPVWSERLKIVPRLTKPGLLLSELPPIDIVLLSHGHYDHLDFATIRQLPPNVLYLVPVGMKKIFLRKGFSRVQEFNWWESTTIDHVRFHFVPAQHWTRRTPFDLNRSHWGGWVMKNESETIYFCGDTGYFRGFHDIHERFQIDIALMPIGAYEPEWFMKHVHMTPEESVRAYKDLGATYFIPMHYGAFALADETPQEALERLTTAWESHQLPPKYLHVLLHGQTLCYNEIKDHTKFALHV